MIRYDGMEPLETGIEILSIGKLYDLHNAGEFKGFRYDSDAKELIFKWNYWESNQLTCKINLVAEGVEDLEIASGDLSLPRDEAECLDIIGVFPERDRLQFTFRDEQEFKFRCTCVKFRLLPVSTDNSKRALEIHDSLASAIEMNASNAVVKFESLFFHVSEGQPGRSRGSCWNQKAEISISDGRIAGGPVDHLIDLSSGEFKFDDKVFENVIPLEFPEHSAVEVSLQTIEGADFRIKGKHATLSWIGEPEYSDEFEP